MTRTPEEQELLAIFRQLSGPAQEEVMSDLREKRDALKRQAEWAAETGRHASAINPDELPPYITPDLAARIRAKRAASGRGDTKPHAARPPSREQDWRFQAFLARASGPLR